MYADDTQMYYSCKCDDANSKIKEINNDLENVSKYSRRNCLKLNAEKSKFIIIGSRPNLKKLKDISLDPIMIDNKKIERVYEAKNLGITFDEELSWVRHVNLQLAKGYGKLKHARRFQKFLDQPSKSAVTETYLLSQLNYMVILSYKTYRNILNINFKNYKTVVFAMLMGYVNMIT